MERRFIRIFHDPREIRMLILTGSVVFLLFLGIDYLLFPGKFPRFAAVRCGLYLPLASFVYFLTYTRFYLEHSHGVILFFGLIPTYSIILLEYLGRGSPYAELYLFGALVVAVFFFGTGKISMTNGFFYTALFFLPAMAVDMTFVVQDDYRLIARSILILATILSGMVSSAIIQDTARKSFLNQLKIQELSMTDPLTGLKNRLFFDDVVKPEILSFLEVSGATHRDHVPRRSDSNPGELSLILLDLDRFKRINDTFGHEAGDAVLREFSRRILEQVRSEDIVFRWGGEEFLMVLRNLDSGSIPHFCKRLGLSISSQPFRLKEGECSMTVSGGVILVKQGVGRLLGSVARMVDLADQALYHSKANGRDRFTQVVVDESPEGKVNLDMKAL